jgi:hypothetical protein
MNVANENLSKSSSSSILDFYLTLGVVLHGRISNELLPRTHEAEVTCASQTVGAPALLAMPSRTTASHVDVSPELRNVHVLQAKIVQLRARDAELTERIERDLREREEVRGALSETEAELETAVQAPVADGSDPTETVPDELLWMILVQVLVGGTCGRVCRRWHAVCAGATAKKEAWRWRWAGYTARRRLAPRKLIRVGAWPRCLAVGLNNKLYTGSTENEHGVIGVWSTLTNTHVQTLRGHFAYVKALVVGKDGTVYSASADLTVRIWSGDDGSHLHTLEGHTDPVICLAVGSDGTVYSGSMDTTIRVWTHGRDGSRLIRTLEGHFGSVYALALSKNGKLYAGSSDTTIRVWSTADGSDLGTLEGHTQCVEAVVVGADGTVYSGSKDGTLRTWSGLDGSAIRTLQMDGIVIAIAIGAGNTVLLRQVRDGTSRVCAWDNGAAPARTLYTFAMGGAMAIGQDGRIFAVYHNDIYEL